MNAFLHILPAILCFALLIPTVSADEIPETDVPAESTAETVWEPYTESLYLGDYEEPAAETETQTEAAMEGETEPTETIPSIPEETTDDEQNALLAELVESQQNTEYAVQTLSGFGLFFVICVLCFFGYKFFRIFF